MKQTAAEKISETKRRLDEIIGLDDALILFGGAVLIAGSITALLTLLEPIYSYFFRYNQIKEIGSLLTIISNPNFSDEERKKALSTLQSKYPKAYKLALQRATELKNTADKVKAGELGYSQARDIINPPENIPTMFGSVPAPTIITT